MAWVSPRVYAILSKSEEGKDIIEKLPDLTQDECQAELDAFFGEGGKGASSSNEYGQAKMDDEAEENAYKAQGDEEISEKDYEDKEEDDEPKGEVTDDEISEALADFEWQITDSTTVGQYAQETADKLGCSKEQVLKVIRQEDPNISEDEKMAKVAGLDDEEPQENEEELEVLNFYDFKDNESGELGKQIVKNTNYVELRKKFRDGDLTEDEEETYEELDEKLEAYHDISKADDEVKAANYIIEKSKDAIKQYKQEVENGDAPAKIVYFYKRALYRKQAAETVLENLKRRIDYGNQDKVYYA